MNQKTTGKKGMIDVDDAVMLLIDHQSGLFQTVKDLHVPELRANVITLAKAATLAKIPVITTASVPQGPNGPLIPEIHKFAAHAKYVARRGQINAWDNPDFVAAVEETGRKTLLIAGTITSVCLAFPSICAVNAAQEITLARIVQAGVIPIDTAAVCSELQQTWNRPDAAQWAEAYSAVFPSYQLLIESYTKAQEVATQHEVLDLQR
jgi:nicotinamidase-related amidase